MRIFSKKAFRFDHPEEGNSERVYVQDQAFADVPDWVEHTTTFKLAAKHDEISVMESKKDEAKAEKAASTKKTVKEEK